MKISSINRLAYVLACSVVLLGIAQSAPAQCTVGQSAVGQSARHSASEADTRGPKSGHLVLSGGGEGNESDRSFFAVEELAREGMDDEEVLNVVVLPTAKSEYNGSFLQRAQIYLQGSSRFKHKFRLTCLHTRSKEDANSEEFCEPLMTADLVVIPGGLTRLLAEAYVGTKLQETLWHVLERGGVVAGGSAGAIIQGTVFSRSPLGRKGFNLLTNSVIDVHVSERNRREHLAKKFRSGELDASTQLGIGIDEGVLAIVSQDTLRVVGEGNVFITNPKAWAGDTDDNFEVLTDGDRYDLKNRRKLPKNVEVIAD